MKQHEATYRRAPAATTTDSNIPTCDKGKRKIVDNAEAEKSCKFRVDLLVEKVTLEIEAKRKQRDRMNAQRHREKWIINEIEEELHELM